MFKLFIEINQFNISQFHTFLKSSKSYKMVKIKEQINMKVSTKFQINPSTNG
jgi:hypothetical protein